MFCKCIGPRVVFCSTLVLPLVPATYFLYVCIL
uniref:Uncharacterized protein n=1 Tax=Anguilla anguilla TaxID=7936 RepID=A0A0E9W4V8_ANGAN